jgi:flavin-dependent dehydrogenase
MIKAVKSVTIAGAGPAGLAAAIHLRRSGVPVTVYERREAVGARFIGEWQILENYSRREDALEELQSMGIATDFEHRPASWAHLFDDRARRREVRSERPYGYFLRRGNEPGTLDRALAAQALALGAEIRYGRKLEPEEADIVATGPGPADGIAKEIAFRTRVEDRIEVIFDPDLAPGGYAYFFVLDGWATLGLALLKGYGRLEAQFERTVARFQRLAPFPIENPRPGYSYMNFFLHPSSERGGKVYAGEAGGFQDYLFGLGNRYALVSGHLAARSLLENVPFDSLWKERFSSAMRSSLAARLLYETLGRHGLRLFVWRSSRADFREFLHSWARPSWWRLLLRPLAERVFGKAENCAHKIDCSWCRPREGRRGRPEALPADFVARYLEE